MTREELLESVKQETKTKKLETYIKTLQSKLEKVAGKKVKTAKAKKEQKVRIAELKSAIKNQKAKLEELKAEEIKAIPAAPTPSEESAPPPEKISMTEIFLGGGLNGGGGEISLGTFQEVVPGVKFGGVAGYGLGTNYNFFEGGVFGRYYLSETMFLGLNINYVNYSKLVELPGVSGRVAKNGVMGGGVSFGLKPVSEMPIVLEIGYHTALGITAVGQYSFLKI